MSYERKPIRIFQKRSIVLLLLFMFMLVAVGGNVGTSLAQNDKYAAINCNTTTSSAGLDLVLPIQAGVESFKTGYWVYQTAGSDHTGKDSCALDFFDVLGKRVVAVADGKVEKAKWQDSNNKAAGYGYYVIVSHEKDSVNYYSVYSHLEDPDTKGFPQECRVATGLSIKAGDCIGISGQTGISPIDHLHFGMWSGTGPFTNTSPIAPENMRGIKLYGKLDAQKPVTTMATAERVTWIMPGLSLKINESQSRTYVFTNTSKITWDESNVFELVKVSGNAPDAPERVSLPEPVEPGKDIAITVPVRGTSPGLFESEWQLHHNNVAFGPTVPLIYTVGVDTEELSNLPSNLWELIKPVVLDYFRNMLLEYLNQLIQDFLNSFFQLCGLAPLGFAGIMFGMVMAGQRNRNNLNFEVKWTGRGTWLTALGQLIWTIVTLLLATLLFKVGRELIWWNGVIKSTGLVILGIGLLLLIWGIIRLVKWIKDLGLKRLIMILLVTLILAIFLHGQRYRADEPVVVRYISSISDLSWLAIDKAIDFGKGSREFANEVAILAGIELPHSSAVPQSIATTTPSLSSPPSIGTASTSDANAMTTETKTACIIVWTEYPADNLGGKNRSTIWDEIVKTQVNGSDMTPSQFISLVLEQNPDLIKDGYEFKNGKKYKLPKCQ